MININNIYADADVQITYIVVDVPEDTLIDKKPDLFTRLDAIADVRQAINAWQYSDE